MRPLYLLDTNLLVHLIRQNPLGQYLNNSYSLLVGEPRPLISVVTDGELRSLALQWGWGSQKNDQVRFLLGYFGRVPVDTEQGLEAYAAVDAYSEGIGRSMGKNDVWIAAASVNTGATLITTDPDFDHLDPKLLRRVWIDPGLQSNLPPKL